IVLLPGNAGASRMFVCRRCVPDRALAFFDRDGDTRLRSRSRQTRRRPTHGIGRVDGRSRPGERRLRCAISGRVRSAEAAIAPGYTARSNNAAAATATAARTATATAATATTAAATATAVCHLLEAGVAAFLVEEVERGEAD